MTSLNSIDQSSKNNTLYLKSQDKLAPPPHSSKFQQQLLQHDGENHQALNRATVYAASHIIPEITLGAQGSMGANGDQGRSSGVRATYTHGKNMYISLDIHGENKKTGENTDKQIINAVKKYPNINFTLYLYERDKGRIPALSKALPNVSFGLHLGPKGKVGDVERFYTYIKGKNIQPINRTPASIHGSGSNRLSGAVMKKLNELHVPFIRTADSTGVNEGKLKKVIGANEGKITEFKNISRMNKFNHYFTHTHHIFIKERNDSEIMKFFNDGAGK